MNIKFVFLIIVWASQISLFAQELVTPEKAIALALENNYGIKLANTDVEIAKNIEKPSAQAKALSLFLMAYKTVNPVYKEKAKRINRLWGLVLKD